MDVLSDTARAFSWTAIKEKPFEVSHFCRPVYFPHLSASLCIHSCPVVGQCQYVSMSVCQYISHLCNHQDAIADRTLSLCNARMDEFPAICGWILTIVKANGGIVVNNADNNKWVPLSWAACCR